jgi:hypothetical protein
VSRDARSLEMIIGQYKIGDISPGSQQFLQNWMNWYVAWVKKRAVLP